MNKPTPHLHLRVYQWAMMTPPYNLTKKGSTYDQRATRQTEPHLGFRAGNRRCGKDHILSPKALQLPQASLLPTLYLSEKLDKQYYIPIK